MKEKGSQGSLVLGQSHHIKQANQVSRTHLSTSDSRSANRTLFSHGFGSGFGSAGCLSSGLRF